jgi:predicted ATPase
MERSALQLAHRLRHAPSLAHTLWFVGEAQVARGDVACGAAIADELLALCEEHKLPQPRATALMFKGWALAQRGETAAGLAKVEEGLAIWDGLGARSYLPRALCLLAECQLLCSRHNEANDALAQGLTVATETGEQWCVARIHALRGELLQAGTSDASGAEAALQAALGVAREQGARLWELRAAISLARIWLDKRDGQHARELLGPVLTRFAADFPSPYVQQAHALLELCADHCRAR